MSSSPELSLPREVREVLVSYQSELHNLGMTFSYGRALLYFTQGFFGTPLSEAQFSDTETAAAGTSYDEYASKYLLKRQQMRFAAGAETYIACGLTKPDDPDSKVESFVNLYKIDTRTGEALPSSEQWIGNIMKDGELRSLINGGASGGFGPPQLQFAVRLLEAQQELGWHPILPYSLS
jgi:hypothetical protein